MSKITKDAMRTVDFFRGRIGARLLLILGCIICISLFSPYVKTVSINADGETQRFITLRNDPQEIMSQYGLSLDSSDTYTVSNDENNVDATITVTRAFELSVNDGGTVTTLELAGGTVADALKTAGVEMPDSDDVINHRTDEELYPYMEIVIDRVEYKEDASSQTIEYKTIKLETADLLKGQTRVVVAGANGERRIVTQSKWVNGKLVSSEIISSKATKDAVTEVIEVGTAEKTSAPTTSSTTKTEKKTTPSTKPTLSTKPTSASNETAGEFVDSNGRTVTYTRKLTGSGTAYTAKPGAKTSTGRVVQSGIVAVDPSIIPYGSRVYVTSEDGKHVYGYALAADTGGALRRGEALVDVFYETESQCRAFGRRNVVVYIL